MYTAAGARPVLERWALAGRSGRLTQAALETLAVIAYKQPISRQEVGDIRGVNADGAVRSLVARGLVEEVGRDEGPGQALLYGTTTLFLERIGIDDLEELPPLTDFLPEAPGPRRARARGDPGGPAPHRRGERAGQRARDPGRRRRGRGRGRLAAGAHPARGPAWGHRRAHRPARRGRPLRRRAAAAGRLRRRARRGGPLRGRRRRCGPRRTQRTRTLRGTRTRRRPQARRGVSRRRSRRTEESQGARSGDG
jgi:hypothetical protein